MDGVSVVIPCYNREAYLPTCIESVLGQEYDGRVEILVGDDGSTDGSVGVAKSFGDAVRVLRHPGGENRGVSATRNLCIQAASQSLIAFLDADDVWLPGHLAAVVGAMAVNLAAGMAYDNGAYLSAADGEFGSRLGPDHTVPTPDVLLLDCSLAVDGVVVRRAVFEQIGLFDEALRSCEDHDMWLRVLENFPAVYVPVNGFLYRMHGPQLTKSTGMWQYATCVLAKAQARYPYRKSTLRKRAAVIAYRLGEAALHERRFLRGAFQLGKAALWDPRRAAKELTRRLARVSA